ncbi:MAG TPA: TlpA family protein disulfide reductase, partial [Candidatus Didemnitutus sp.]|nr:TlpA family protein disulfide reductase [Candidatus Didemnitutus sp.]
MKKNVLAAACAALVTVLPVSRALAQEPAPATPAAAPATSGPSAEFRALFARITEKLKAGQSTEEQLAPEIKEFDALLAKYADQKTDEVATISFMKARLYIEVFEDLPKGVAMLKQTKANFPNTEIAGKLDEIIDTLEKQAAAESSLAVGKVFPAFSEQDLDGKPL